MLIIGILMSNMNINIHLEVLMTNKNTANAMEFSPVKTGDLFYI